MVKSSTKKSYTTGKKSLKKDKKTFDCSDVEKYLDKAVTNVKNEILPRIENIDSRDKSQFETARKLIMDANSIMIGRQNVVEKTVNKMESELSEVYESRKMMVKELTDSFDKLHVKLDNHVISESEEFKNIRTKLEKAATHVETIQRTLDDVSANGNKGLSASFTDVYNKLKEMEKITEGARARAHFWVSAKHMMDTAWFMFPFKTKWGAIVAVAIFLLVLNSILHGLNIDMNLQSIINWGVATFGKKG